MPDLLTTAQAAEHLGIDPSGVRRYARLLHVGTRLGRDWLFSADELARLATRRRPGRPHNITNAPNEVGELSKLPA